MWPLNFSASCLLLVLDLHSNSPSAATIDSLVELSVKALNAARTMVDFAPTTTSAGNVLNPSINTTNNMNANPSSSSPVQDDWSIDSNLECPAGAIFAVLLNSNNGSQDFGKCVCLWSPISSSGGGFADNILNEENSQAPTRNVRSGEKIRQIVRRNLSQHLLSFSSSSDRHSSSNTFPATLEALIRCTATLQQLQLGSEQQQRLPSLLRIIATGSTDDNRKQKEDDDDNTTQSDNNSNNINHDWRDSVCSLISTWENLNVKVSIEKQNNDNTFTNTLSCPVLSYLTAVSCADSNVKNSNHVSSFKLTFVCPKCRSMITPKNSKNNNDLGLLSIVALQEPPKCPRGCLAW